jgi:hypothetical protein
MIESTALAVIMFIIGVVFGWTIRSMKRRENRKCKN